MATLSSVPAACVEKIRLPLPVPVPVWTRVEWKPSRQTAKCIRHLFASVQAMQRHSRGARRATSASSVSHRIHGRNSRDEPQSRSLPRSSRCSARFRNPIAARWEGRELERHQYQRCPSDGVGWHTLRDCDPRHAMPANQPEEHPPIEERISRRDGRSCSGTLLAHRAIDHTRHHIRNPPAKLAETTPTRLDCILRSGV